MKTKETMQVMTKLEQGYERVGYLIQDKVILMRA